MPISRSLNYQAASSNSYAWLRPLHATRKCCCAMNHFCRWTSATIHHTAVVFVTHEINPVLPYVDRVLYLAGGRFSMGTVDTVLTSSTLTHLYRTPVDVLRMNGRIVVLGVPDASAQAHQDTAATVGQP